MKIYLDENLSKYVADALNLLSKGYFPNIEVYSTIDVFGRGVRDEDIIPKIGTEGSILITKDFNIKKTTLQYELCQQYNLGIFFITLPKNQDKHWEIVKLIIQNWEELIQKIGRDKHPFAYRIRIKGKMEKL
jgi:predicted nuclease of predicted toxin-antitoxin system